MTSTQTKVPKKAAPIISLSQVKSSSVVGFGYDAASKTLAVQFKGGGKTYHYEGVPETLFGDMAKSESVGKFVCAHVAGKFKHTLQVKAD